MENLKFIKTIEPSKDEIIKNAKNWYEPMRGLNMDEWNENLKRVSFPFYILKLPSNLCIDAINGIDRKKEFKEIFEPFISEIGYKEYFVKAITRSPKDYLQDEPNGMMLSNSDDTYIALFSSMRTAEDLCMLSSLDKCEIVVRPFIGIPKWQEFRVFVFGKQIVGISQYFYNETFGIFEWENLMQKIEKSIRDFVSEEIMPFVQRNHFVVDVCSNGLGDIHMIELNPFGLSDPCLFESYDALDGTFRYNKK